jgi:hypothetical protein
MLFRRASINASNYIKSWVCKDLSDKLSVIVNKMFAAQVTRLSAREKHQPCSVKDLPRKPEGYPRE